MGRKIFLDVGCNTGQSLEAALDHDFDVVYCFEPVMEYCQSLQSGVLSSDVGSGIAERPYDQTRVVICPFGLWVNTERISVHSPHTMAASVFDDHQDSEGGTTECQFVKASEWLRHHITDDDFVVMKMNCEGSECTILDHLMDSDTIHLIDHIMVDFDAMKIPSQRHRPQRTIWNLNNHGVDYVFAEDVMCGATHHDRICYWLKEKVEEINER
jgi:FkbM family methyltransferase